MFVINSAQHAEKVQPPYDFYAVYDGIVERVVSKS